ncbi:hypothetical protein PIROE2DRAFT_8497 [Piromyces sp. E2]|nr:hypothetical protein PIROE2DRAFT_8497 [Piromyces sp. E2]|eukprot:OUM64659.1 hypothetical protein PIROE2DRAFT_8497 [Piromyces sp. E2]
MTTNPHRPIDYREIQTNINDFAPSSSSTTNNNNVSPEYTNFQQSLIQKLNSTQYKNQMNMDYQASNTQGIMDYEEFSLNQSAAEVLTDNGILALHVLSNSKNPVYIRQKMKRYLSKIDPDSHNI